MELSNTKSPEILTINLFDPATGNPLGASVEVYHRDSEHFKAARHRQNNRILELRRKGVQVSSEMMEANNRSLLAENIISWDWGDHTYDGKPIGDFTKSMAIELLKSLPWFFDQINTGMAGNATFLGDAPKS